MLQISRVLAPVDFSKPSRAAAVYAAALAKATGARLSLLHMVEPVSFDYSMVPASEHVLRELTASRTAHAVGAIESLIATDTVVEYDVVEGDPATEILARAKSDQSDLIVMSTRGAGAFKRVLGVGSVTLNVLAGAGCPVLTGTDFAAPPRLDGGTIVCALDLSANAERPFRWACDAARTFRARLAVVHATIMADKTRFDLVTPDWSSEVRRRVEQHLRDLVARSGVDATVVVGDGPPHEVVAETARDLDAAVVVIGRSPANDMMDRLRAHSYDIIRRAPCPVVSV